MLRSIAVNVCVSGGICIAHIRITGIMVPVAICGQDGVVLPTRQLIPVGILPGVIRLEIARGALQCPFERRVAARPRTLSPGVEIGAFGPREPDTPHTNKNWVRRPLAPRFV